MNGIKALGILFLLGALTGCGTWGSYFPAKVENPQWRQEVEAQEYQRQLAGLLERFNALAVLPRGSLSKEYDRALLEWASGEKIPAGMEAAFIHALLGCPAKGARQTRSFLNRFDKSPSPLEGEGYRGLVALIALVTDLCRENEQLRVGISEEKERSEKLAHQLKELKNIEKIIYERENHQIGNN